MQKTYAHPEVFTLGAGLKTLKLVVGASREEIIVDFDKRSVTSQCGIFSATITVALGKSEAEVEITVLKSFGAELRFGINFETRAVIPLGDSVISSPVSSMALFMMQQYGSVCKTLLVTQGPPPLFERDHYPYTELFFDLPRESSLINPDRKMDAPRRMELSPERYPDPVIQPYEGFNNPRR